MNQYQEFVKKIGTNTENLRKLEVITIKAAEHSIRISGFRVRNYYVTITGRIIIKFEYDQQLNFARENDKIQENFTQKFAFLASKMVD